MDWIIGILVLAAAFIGLIAAQFLRAVFGWAYPHVRATLLPAATPPPAAIADLIENALPELQAAGFEGPHWVALETDPEASQTSPVIANFLARDERTVVHFSDPIDFTMPNQPMMWVTSRLDDDRLATTQAFEPSHGVLATPEAPGQTVAAETVDELLSRHRQWLDTLDRQPAPRKFSSSELCWLLGEASNEHRERLVSQGKLKRDKQGLVRLRLPTALRMLWAHFTRPKSKITPEPVPVARLLSLASVCERVQHRIPPKTTQWTMFLASIAAFMLLGTWFWNATFALMLLFVIAFHELGHYLAMRAFGYKQVHVLMLPLVGGVTVGQEQNPNANHRAWMAMMGPLPGIMLGWILLVLALRVPELLDAAPWLLMLAAIMLAVNYLNLLPIPPLDGGHILQSVLPHGGYRLRVGVVLVACLAGITAAIMAGLPLLAIIAGLPLLGLKSTLATGAAHRYLMAQHPQPASQPGELDLPQALQALEEYQGPTREAAGRISQARELVADFKLKTMSHFQRLILGTTYTIVFAVPLSGGALAIVGLGGFNSFNESDDYWADYVQVSEQEMARAMAMDTGALLQELTADKNGDRLVTPATPNALAAAQQRLGVQFHDELLAFYQITDGLPALNLAASHSLQSAADCAGDTLEIYRDTGSLTATTPDSDTWVNIDPNDLTNWLCLQSADYEYDYHYLLIAPAGEAIEGMMVLSTDGYLYPTLHAWLAQRLTDTRVGNYMTAKREARTGRALADLDAASMDDLLARMPQPGFFERLLFSIPPRPGPASTTQLNAVEQRLGYALPSELQELFSHHNGLPEWRLLSTEELIPLADIDQSFLPETLPEALAAHGLSTTEQGHCLVVFGSRVADAGVKPIYMPSLLWCQSPQGNLWYESYDEARHDSLKAYLRLLVARQH